MKKVRVLVVDDSALMRKLLTSLLAADPDIEVVGSAEDAYIARDMIKNLRPDVLTLDIEMPKMDGITFLGNLMRLKPMPVVMISTLTEKGAGMTMRALELGAVDFVSKPKVNVEAELEQVASEIRSKVKTAGLARVDSLGQDKSSETSGTLLEPITIKNIPGAKQTNRIIAIGASTGGTKAIKDVLAGLKPSVHGIVISQHIPPVFSKTFAERMHRCTGFNVFEAEDGQPIKSGHVYIAPGDYHLEVERQGSGYCCKLTQADPVNRHRPSVDVLFDSVAKTAGRNALGVILTGMGKDGAEGLKRMRDSGCETVAQDEETSVVWGMPGAAVKADAATHILPLKQVAGKISEFASL